MKKSFLFLGLLFLSLAVTAQPPVGKAQKGDQYGQKISSKGAITLEELSNKLVKKDSLATKIKGKVLEVCSKKGCWLTMEMPDKTNVHIKFKDYGFFVPTALAGKTVVLDGVARQKITSVNELKHYAEDAKKPQSEIDAITRPEKQVQFIADGVLVL